MQTVRLNYAEFGVGNKVKLLILHGFFASNRNWRQIAEQLSIDYHVYNLDLRNHGASDHHDVMDYPTMTADLLAFMDNHALQHAVIMGHSMGGKVAMWLALHHPERVDKLIIADIAPKAYQHSFNPLIAALKSLPLTEIRNRKQAEEFLAPAIPELSYRQFLLQNLVLKDGDYAWRINLAIFQAAAPAIVGFPNVSDETAFLGSTLFLAGGQSNYVNADDIVQTFPNGQFISIADAGHWLHVQQPKKFIAHIRQFLR